MQKLSPAIILIGALLMTAGAPLSPLHAQIIGQVGGRVEDVAVQGDYAYVAVGLRLVILDVAQPSAPTEIGSTTPFPEFVEGVAVSGSLAYVADGMAGLYIVDVSDPLSPVVVGSYDTPGYTEGVTIADRYAYVADGHDGLRIVDVSDPTSPREVGHAFSLNYVFEVALEGSYAYLAAAGAGLLVVDISDPTRPVEIGGLDTPGYAFGVDVAGGIAWVADGWEDLRVIDVSAPAHPVELASHETPGWAFGVRVGGGTAYVADAFGGLQLLDVSIPSAPVGLGGYEIQGGHAGRVAVVGDTAFVADRNRGLHVIDVSDPHEVTPVGLYSPMGRAVEVAVSGDYAYVAAATYGLRVVDISDPARPSEVGACDIQSYARSIDVAGDYAYVIANNGFHVVDVSDPENPVRVAYLDLMVGTGRDIVVVGTIAYIPDEHGLRLLDVSTPSAPTAAGYIDFQGEEEWKATSGVDVAGSYAYVAGDGGFYVVDVSEPASPTLVTTYGPGCFDVAVAGPVAYLAGAGESLAIVDISDPTRPFRIGGYSGSHGAERVVLAGETAYLGGGTKGLVGIDVTNPATPAVAGLWDTPGYAFAAEIVNQHVYVADHHGGMVVLDLAGSTDAGSAAASGIPVSRPTSSTGDWAAQPAHREYHRRLHPRPPLHKGIQAKAARPQGQLGIPRSAARSSAETCVVTNAADGGPGTLRACLEGAQSGDTITFDPNAFPPDNPVAIALQTGLPCLCQGRVSLDASDAGVILDGSGVQDGVGLRIASENNVVRGLQVVGFSVIGISLVEGADDNIIGGDRTVGRGPTGQGNRVSLNLIGIEIQGNNNTVVGNLVGTDASGSRPLGNAQKGVWIVEGSNNTIGGVSPGTMNLITANGGFAQINLHRANGNVVIGNYIGTDITGMVDLGNAGTGVLLELGSYDNLVVDNLISGSNWGGVGISDWGSSYNIVAGNRVGIDASGTRALGNRWGGVAAGFGGADFNLIGGTSPGDGNVIGGNPRGVDITGTGNLVLGNLIGTDAVGNDAIANEVGVFIGDSGNHNFVGGTTPAERNVISGNASAGIRVGGAEHNFILGNYIGSDAGGALGMPNGASGIESGSAKHTVIQGNVISGNAGAGVTLEGASLLSHLRANRIGLAADGMTPLLNGAEGVAIHARSNTIGGPHPEDGNTIAFNAGDGVMVWQNPNNTIRRNSIYANSGSGIALVDGANNRLASPVITSVSRSSVAGNACPGCEVEIFSDAEDEGCVFEGSTVADPFGYFTFTTFALLTGPNVTATASDSDGNTSEFSAPHAIPPPPPRRRGVRHPRGEPD